MHIREMKLRLRRPDKTVILPPGKLRNKEIDTDIYFRLTREQRTYNREENFLKGRTNGCRDLCLVSIPGYGSQCLNHER